VFKQLRNSAVSGSHQNLLSCMSRYLQRTTVTNAVSAVQHKTKQY